MFSMKTSGKNYRWKEKRNQNGRGEENVCSEGWKEAGNESRMGEIGNLLSFLDSRDWPVIGQTKRALI